MKRRSRVTRSVRSLRLESLESRNLLAGVVNVAWPGTGAFAVIESAGSPGSDSEIQIESTEHAGEYVIRGLNGTRVELNGAGANDVAQTVNAITGTITVDLGPGSDKVLFAEGFTAPLHVIINSNGANDENVLGVDVDNNGSVVDVTINGSLEINNAPGTKNTLSNVAVIGDVFINNDNGTTNAITNGTTINNGLWVHKVDGLPAGSTSLVITDSTIVGITDIRNESLQGNGVTWTGGASTTIINGESQLLGPAAAIAAVPSLPSGLAHPASRPVTAPQSLALRIQNGAGIDTLKIQPNTVVGTAPGVIGVVAPLPVVVQVVNGAGGSLTQFGPVSATDAGRVTVNGTVAIENGANAFGIMDVLRINRTDVLGGVYVYNDGGPGATNTVVANSVLGKFLAPGGVGLGHPVVVINDNGEDSFLMEAVVSSDPNVPAEPTSAPWGVFIHNDDNAALPGLPDPTTWTSTTHIMNSDIGTRPGGPSVFGLGGAALTAQLATLFPAAAPFALPGLIAPGDALVVGGGAGADNITVDPTQIGGRINLLLGSGNNNVTFLGELANPVKYPSMNITTGAGNDTVRLENVAVLADLALALDGGNDILELVGSTRLPEAGVGTYTIDGGTGNDTLMLDETVELSIDLFTLFAGITGFNP